MERSGGFSTISTFSGALVAYAKCSGGYRYYVDDVKCRVYNSAYNRLFRARRPDQCCDSVTGKPAHPSEIGMLHHITSVQHTYPPEIAAIKCAVLSPTKLLQGVTIALGIVYKIPSGLLRVRSCGPLDRLGSVNVSVL